MKESNKISSIDISDKLRSEILEVILLLKDTRALTECDKNGWFRFEPSLDGFLDDYEEEYPEALSRLLQKCNRSLELLSKHKVIQIKSKNEKLPHTTMQKVYVKYTEGDLRKVENELTRSLKKTNDVNIEVVTIFYNENGEIWREPRASHLYDGKLNNQSKVFIHIADNAPEYVPTADIALHIEVKNPRQVNDIVSKLKNLLLNNLSVDGSIVIEGKKKAGYRINPKVKLEKR